MYDLSNKFANISKIFFDSAIKTWTPFFLKNSEKNDENSKKKIVKMYNYFLSFFTIGSLLIIFFSEEFVKLLTNEEFYEIIFYIPLIAAYIFIVHSINIISKAQLIASKKLKYYVYASATSLIINVVDKTELESKKNEKKINHEPVCGKQEWTGSSGETTTRTSSTVGQR